MKIESSTRDATADATWDAMDAATRVVTWDATADAMWEFSR